MFAGGRRSAPCSAGADVFDDAALLRLAASLLVEQNDEWLVQQRYLSLGSIARLAEPSGLADDDQPALNGARWRRPKIHQVKGRDVRLRWWLFDRLGALPVIGWMYQGSSGVARERYVLGVNGRCVTEDRRATLSSLQAGDASPGGAGRQIGVG